MLFTSTSYDEDEKLIAELKFNVQHPQIDRTNLL